MKKLLTISLIIMLALVCVFATGCSRVEGNYTLKCLRAGMTQINVGEDYNGEPLTSGYVVLNLKGDNTATLLIGDIVNLNGTWEKSKTEDDEILLKFGRTEIYAEFDDGEIEFSYLGVEYEMLKV